MAQPALPNEAYTVAWICALDLEMAACLLVLDELHGKPQGLVSTSQRSYQLGSIGGHNIVIACLPLRGYGTNNAAVVVTNLKTNFPSIEFGFLVGIGGAIPNDSSDIRLGDIVVGTPERDVGGVIQHDIGKIRGGALERIGSLNKPPAILLVAAAQLKASHLVHKSRIPEFIANAYEKHSDSLFQYRSPGSDNDNFYPVDYEHEGGSTCESCSQSRKIARTSRKDANPVIHYGVIASGNQVVKHAATRDRIGKELGAICFEMEAAGVVDNLPCLVIRGISDYSDSHKNDHWQPYAALTASAYAKELLGEVAPVVARVSYQKISEEDLPRVHDASFNSYSGEILPECLPNTRTDLLDDIKEWMESPDSKKIFWLCGQAGTGKSTISRTIARMCSEKRQLGASFFFKRGETNRGNASKFCSTIVSDLIQFVPQLASHINKVIQEDRYISKKRLKEQFTKLINKPLSQVKLKSPLIVVIVIDALDECEGDIMKELIENLAGIKTVKPLQIRLFVTSRPDVPIRVGFKALKDGSYESLDLRDIENPTIEHDIKLFFEKQFAEMRSSHLLLNEDEETDNDGDDDDDKLLPDWPGDEVIQKLVKITSPWFIAASTICKFIAKSDTDPRKRLHTILKSGTSGRPSLTKIYQQVLDQLLIKKEDEDGDSDEDDEDKDSIIEDFVVIVGTIILLETPLSRVSLSQLLRRRQSEISVTLLKLQSILSVPTEDSHPIRTLHLSIREFLTSKKKAGAFYIDEKKRHAVIAQDCIKLLSATFKKTSGNICGLKSTAETIDKTNLHELEKHVPKAVQYASRYWIHHLKLAGEFVGDDSQVHIFLKSHLLQWLEVAGLCKTASDMTSEVVELCYMAEEGSQLSKLLYDLRRLILRNQYIIDKAPLQTYSSVLLFAPEQSTIRKYFAPHFPSWIHFTSKREELWGPLIQTIDVGERSIKKLLPAPQYTQLASVANSFKNGPSAKLWDGFNGTLLQNFNIGEAEYVQDITFSVDGNVLLVALGNQTIQLWDTSNGKLLRSLRLSSSGIKSIDCSREQIATAMVDCEIILWDLQSGTVLRKLEGLEGHPQCVAYSYDGVKLACTTKSPLWNGSGCLYIWNSATNELLQKVDLHEQWIPNIAFSLDDEHLAGASSDGTVMIWRLSEEKYSLVQSLCGHNSAVCHVSFSPEGSYLASSSGDDTAKVWSVASWALLQSFQAPSVINSWITPDGQQLLSISSDGLIKLWEIHERHFLKDKESRKPDKVGQVKFSPDGSTLAAQYFSNKLELWDATTYELMLSNSPTEYSPSQGFFDFSSDGNFMMLGPCEFCIMIWNLSTNTIRITEPGQGIHPGLNDAAFSPDNSRIAGLTTNGMIQVWDRESGKIIQTLEYSGILHSITFAPNGTQIIAGGFRKMEVWDLPSGELLRTFHGHESYIKNLQVSSNDKRIVSVSIDRDVKIWDFDTGDVLHTFECDGQISEVEFLPDSERLVISVDHRSSNSKLSWDPTTDEVLELISQSCHTSDVVASDLELSYTKPWFKAWIAVSREYRLWVPEEYRMELGSIAFSRDLVAVGSESVIILRSSLPKDLGLPERR